LNPPLNKAPEFIYKIQYGDTLSRISYKAFRRVDLPLMQLANPGIKDVNRIYAGKIIQIPKPGFWANKWKRKGDYLGRYIIDFDAEKMQATMLLYYINYEKYDTSNPYRLIFVLIKQKQEPEIIFDTNSEKKLARYNYGVEFSGCKILDLDGDGDRDFIVQFYVRAVPDFETHTIFHKEGNTYQVYKIDENGRFDKIENRVLFFSGTEKVGNKALRDYHTQYHWTGKGFRRASIKYSNLQLFD
jgi:hypothetical protein